MMAAPTSYDAQKGSTTREYAPVADPFYFCPPLQTEEGATHLVRYASVATASTA